MRIAMDIDGVVANTSEILKEVAKDFGYVIVFDSYKPDVVGITDAEKFYNKIVVEAFSNRMEQILPYQDAVLSIPSISKYIGAITFITARRIEYQQPTLDWLNEHFNISFGFVNVPSAEKAQFILDEGFDVFVEDRLRTANQAAELGIKTYLINRPWNVGRSTHEKVIRINSLIGFYSMEV